MQIKLSENMGEEKRAFNLSLALRRIRKAVEPFAKAALFELADEGRSSVFEQIVACIVSVRTLDATTLRVSRRLFARARTPRAMQRPFSCPTPQWRAGSKTPDKW